MFVILRTDAISDMVGLQNVFLTEEFLCFFVLAVGTEDLAL